MPNILQALTSPNVDIDSSGVPRGSNTVTATNIWPDNWVPWKEFNYKTLIRIFDHELQMEYRGSSVPWALPADLAIQNEGTLEDLLRRFTIPTVNYALAEQNRAPYIGRGSRARSDADWAVTSVYYIEEDGTLTDFLPGDTKLNAKWWVGMEESDETFDEWQKVVSQVMTYMAAKRSRYGFIITDAALVALRITREPTHPGLAQSRPRRAAATAPSAYGGHQRYPSDVTMASASASGSAYSDSDPLAWGYYAPEYAHVPWGNHGKKLTVELALFCLSLMGMQGDNFIDYSYPPLDSYRTGEGKKGFVHNTSGVKVTKLPKSAEQVERDPQRAWREEQEPHGVSETAAQDQDMPQYSQPPSNFGDSPGRYEADSAPYDEEDQQDDYSEYAEGSTRPSQAAETGNEDEYDDDDNDQGGGDDEGDGDDEGGQTETGHSSSRRRTQVSVTRAFRGGYKFTYKKREIRTTRKDWTPVSDGFEYRGRKHTYYTSELPQ